MIVREPNREYNLDITDESCGVIANASALARSLPFFIYCAGQIGAKKECYTKTWYLEGFLLLVTTRGQGSFTYQGKTCILGAGDVVFIDCTQYHEYCTLGDFWENYYIRFDGSAAGIYHDYINRGGWRVLSCSDINATKKLVGEIINLCLSPDEHAPLEISLALSRILTELAVSAHKGMDASELSPSVQQAKEFIDQHYAGQITLNDIARASLLSPYHLSRTFKTQIGVSPHAYLNQRRLDKAKRLLLTTQMTVQDISDRVGFSNVNILIRSFKNAAGMTPTAFRSKNFY